jgi:hypothetical protein
MNNIPSKPKLFLYGINKLTINNNPHIGSFIEDCLSNNQKKICSVCHAKFCQITKKNICPKCLTSRDLVRKKYFVKHDSNISKRYNSNSLVKHNSTKHIPAKFSKGQISIMHSNDQKKYTKKYSGSKSKKSVKKYFHFSKHLHKNVLFGTKMSRKEPTNIKKNELIDRKKIGNYSNSYNIDHGRKKLIRYNVLI